LDHYLPPVTRVEKGKKKASPPMKGKKSRAPEGEGGKKRTPLRRRKGKHLLENEQGYRGPRKRKAWKFSEKISSVNLKERRSDGGETWRGARLRKGRENQGFR